MGGGLARGTPCVALSTLHHPGFTIAQSQRRFCEKPEGGLASTPSARAAAVLGQDVCVWV